MTLLLGALGEASPLSGASVPWFGERASGYGTSKLPDSLAPEQKLLVTEMRKYRGCGSSKQAGDWDPVGIILRSVPGFLMVAPGPISSLLQGMWADLDGHLVLPALLGETENPVCV